MIGPIGLTRLKGDSRLALNKIALGAAGIFTLALLIGPCRASGISAGVQWHRDFSSAQADASRSHRPIMVDLYAASCAPCEAMDREVFSQQVVIRTAAQFAPVRMDIARDGASLAARYGVDTAPTILFLDAYGVLAGAIVDDEPADVMAADLDRIAERERKLWDLRTANAAHPDDLDAGVKLALELSDQGRAAELEAVVSSLEMKAGTDRSPLAPVYNQMAMLSLRQGETAKALASSLNAVSAGKDPASLGLAHFNLGRCYYSLNQKPKARSEWQTVVDLTGVPTDLKTRAQESLERLKAEG